MNRGDNEMKSKMIVREREKIFKKKKKDDAYLKFHPGLDTDTIGKTFISGRSQNGASLARQAPWLQIPQQVRPTKILWRFHFVSTLQTARIECKALRNP